MKTAWTDEEINTLISLWPTHTAMQIADTLHRSPSAISGKVKQVRDKKGLLKAKNAPRCRSINPDPQDFDDVKRDYCRKHHISIAKLGATLEHNGLLAAELYRLAEVAKLTRLRPRG